MTPRTILFTKGKCRENLLLWVSCRGGSKWWQEKLKFLFLSFSCLSWDIEDLENVLKDFWLWIENRDSFETICTNGNLNNCNFQNQNYHMLGLFVLDEIMDSTRSRAYEKLHERKRCLKLFNTYDFNGVLYFFPVAVASSVIIVLFQ